MGSHPRSIALAACMLALVGCRARSSEPTAPRWEAGSGAVWDLSCNDRRPDG